MLVCADGKLLGAIHLKDVVKPGIRERFAELRKLGIRTVMVTGDNPLTAAAIAAEAGVDDVLAEATPEKKLARIRHEQNDGRLVAMCGDGANDAPALAQADVGMAMNDGTQAAREAANMVDLDSDPTKLLDVVQIGKELLVTRGALTTFSIANDVAKYFAILPALFAAIYPQLGVLNVMQLQQSAERDSLGDRVQRPDHRGADSAGVARCAGAGGECGGVAAAQSADLWAGRDCGAVRGHQGDRHAVDGVASGLTCAVCQTHRLREQARSHDVQRISAVGASSARDERDTLHLTERCICSSNSRILKCPQ